MKNYDTSSGTMNILSISPEDIDEMLNKMPLNQTSDQWAQDRRILQTVP